MIKILKDGVKPKPTKTIYEATCFRCGCIFEFEAKDVKSQEKRLGGHIIIECPCCHIEIIQSKFKQREEEVEENDIWRSN